MQNIKVKEFTTPIIHVIDQNARAQEAYELMIENDIRHLPVSNGNNIIGIISERDVMGVLGSDWSSEVLVNDFMSEDILSVHKDEGIGRVAYELSANKIGSAIVLDDNGKVYGIFTVTDALNALVEVFVSDAFNKSDLKGAH